MIVSPTRYEKVVLPARLFRWMTLRSVVWNVDLISIRSISVVFSESSSVQDGISCSSIAQSNVVISVRLKVVVVVSTA